MLTAENSINDRQTQALLKLSVDEMLICMDPVDRLRKNRACVVRVSDTYPALIDFYEDVLEKLLFKSYSRMLKNEFQNESDENPYDMHETIKPFLANQPRVKKVYISIMSDNVWDNFLLNTVSGKTGECDMDRVEVVFTDDEHGVNISKVPVHYNLTMDNAKLLLETEEFPFNKKNIYFLKQELRFRDKEELHYYLYIPQVYFK